MVNTVWVNTDHGQDLHLLADYMTQLNNFTKEENRDFSAFRFSLQLMLQQFNNVSDDFTKTTYKSHKRASMLQWILGRSGFCKIYLK